MSKQQEQKRKNDSMSVFQSDIIHFAVTLTVRKITNIIHLRWSYFKSRFSRKLYHNGYPISLSIEPTTSCNLNCLECPVGQNQLLRTKGHLSMELYTKAIDEVRPWLSYLMLYFQGEPFLHPELFEMISYAKKAGIYTTTSTNGHFLSPEIAKKTVHSGLDRIIISLDGTDQESYQFYRNGGNYQTVVDGIQQLVQAKKNGKSSRPFIELQFIVMNRNEHQIRKIITLGKTLGVNNTVLKSVQVTDFSTNAHLLPTLTRFSRYRITDSGKYTIKSTFPNHCWRAWSSCVLTWDGQVLPCCFDKDATHSFGKAKVKNVLEFWNGKEAEAFRTKICTNRKQLDMCRNCTEGLDTK